MMQNFEVPWAMPWPRSNLLKLEQCLALATQLHKVFKTDATFYTWEKRCRNRKWYGQHQNLHRVQPCHHIAVLTVGLLQNLWGEGCG